jgi:hypothetical protein
MINKVERGEASPTASLLGRLAGAFGLTLSMLLARTETDHIGRLVRANEQSRWTDPKTGYIRRQIAPAPGSDIPLDVVQVELPPSTSVTFPARNYVSVRQLIWVLKGRDSSRQKRVSVRSVRGVGHNSRSGTPISPTRST